MNVFIYVCIYICVYILKCIYTHKYVCKNTFLYVTVTSIYVHIFDITSTQTDLYEVHCFNLPL